MPRTIALNLAIRRYSGDFRLRHRTFSLPTKLLRTPSENIFMDFAVEFFAGILSYSENNRQERRKIDRIGAGSYTPSMLNFAFQRAAPSAGSAAAIFQRSAPVRTWEENQYSHALILVTDMLIHEVEQR